MIVEQIWTGNAYRNFNYLIVCPETGDALAIDPLDYEKCLAAAASNGWTITQILNTHEHGDHTGGNENIGNAGTIIVSHDNVRKRLVNGSYIAAFGMNAPPASKAALPILTFSQSMHFHMPPKRMNKQHP